MNVILHNVWGLPDAVVSMMISTGRWTPEKEEDIRKIFQECLDEKGFWKVKDTVYNKQCMEQADKYMQRLVKWGTQHITLLRFVNFSATVQGLHRAGQDDWDAHAQRFNNRIIRMSTRYCECDTSVSDYYKDKIIPTDVYLEKNNIEIPNEITVDGVEYVKGVNGYIRKDLQNQQDVKRGLYMLSLPSNYIFQCDITQWSHVYKERCNGGHAHPEVKECCEMLCDRLLEANPYFSRDLFEKIKN